MRQLRDFVRARLDEHDVPDPVHRAYTGILALSDTVRSDGEDEEWLTWLTGSVGALEVGEYIFGADPASDAERISDRLRATLARTWADHPDYRPEWAELAIDPPDGS